MLDAARPADPNGFARCVIRPVHSDTFALSAAFCRPGRAQTGQEAFRSLQKILKTLGFPEKEQADTIGNDQTDKEITDKPCKSACYGNQGTDQVRSRTRNQCGGSIDDVLQIISAYSSAIQTHSNSLFSINAGKNLRNAISAQPSIPILIISYCSFLYFLYCIFSIHITIYPATTTGSATVYSDSY